MLTAGCCGNIVIQQGFGPASPTYQLTNASDDAAGNTALGRRCQDGSGGRQLGLQCRQRGHLAPAGGADSGYRPEGADPEPIRNGRAAHARRPRHRPGVFAAYPADFGTTTHVRLLRYGGGSVAVGSVKGLLPR